MHKSARHCTSVPGVEAISIISDRSFPRHTHDEFGLGYLVDGAQKSWSGRGEVEAAAGDIITVNPGELHDGIGRKGSPRHWRMLFLASETIERITEHSEAKFEMHYPVLRDERKQALVAQAIFALTCDDPDPDHIEEQLLLALRSMMDSVSEAQPTKIHSCAVKRVVERIEAESALPLSLSDYAVTAQMSRYQILRHFSAQVGTTPHAFLLQHRVKQARLHMQTGISLADAAIASGFADQSHMTRAFVRQLGITPGSYMRAQAI